MKDHDVIYLGFGAFCLVVGLLFGLMSCFSLWSSAELTNFRHVTYKIKKKRELERKKTVAILQLGKRSFSFPKKFLFESFLNKKFRRTDIRLMKPQFLPKEAYHDRFKRFRADRLCAFLSRKKPAWATFILGLTSVDISTTLKGFQDHAVFGLADVGGVAAIVSSFQLRRVKSQHQKIKAWKALLLHEMGHMLGLRHCPDKACVMFDAGGSLDLFLRSSFSFCSVCLGDIKD